VAFGNWFAVVPVCEALSSHFNLDTKEAWEGVPLNLRQQWSEINKLMDDQHAAKLKIRMLQSLNAPPAIPIMSVVIADVHSLLKTYPDPYLNAEKTVIHFARCGALSELLVKRVILPQQTSYKFYGVPVITRWFTRGDPSSTSSSETLPSDSPVGKSEASNHEAAAILDMLQHDKQFRDEVKEMIRSVIRGQFDQLRQEIAPSVDIADVAAKQFPGQEVTNWKRFDDSGIVYGRPSEVQLRVVTKNSVSCILETREVATPIDIQHLIRVGKFFLSSNPKQVVRCMLVTRSLNPKTQRMAERAKIEVLIAR
jgi:hypothetical protein